MIAWILRNKWIGYKTSSEFVLVVLFGELIVIDIPALILGVGYFYKLVM